MLEVQDLHAFYGKSHVLRGLCMSVELGEIVCLLGRNGSGRSTALKTIMGLVHGRGSVTWRGRQLLGCQPFEIAHQGLGYVPEGRDIFPNLTVQQNLLLGEKRGHQGSRWNLSDMYAMFPLLRERQHTAGGVLSGGEQQMLALCRTLLGDPDLLMVDEPTEGLAPKLVEELAGHLKEIQRRGVAVLLVEQKLTIALDVSQRCYVMGHGGIVFEGPPAGLRENAAVRKEWLEI